MIKEIGTILTLFDLFSTNFVKEFKGTNLDKSLTDKERKELFKIVGESFNQAIIDMLDKCNEEKIEGDRKDA